MASPSLLVKPLLGRCCCPGSTERVRGTSRLAGPIVRAVSAAATLVATPLGSAQGSTSTFVANNVVVFTPATDTPRFNVPPSYETPDPSQQQQQHFQLMLGDGNKLMLATSELHPHDVDAAEAHDRLQDASTFLMLGCADGVLPRRSSPSVPALSGGFNLKKLTSFRDNVLRNVAPAVALGWQQGARIASEAKARKVHALLMQQHQLQQERQRQRMLQLKGSSSSNLSSTSSQGSTSNQAVFASGSGIRHNNETETAQQQQQQNSYTSLRQLCPAGAATASGSATATLCSGRDGAAVAAAPSPLGVPSSRASDRSDVGGEVVLSASAAVGRPSRRRRGSRVGDVLEGAGRRRLAGDNGAAGAASYAWI